MPFVAVFASTNPAATAVNAMRGSLDQIALNIPPGGTWRPMPAGVRQASACPPLAQMPAQPTEPPEDASAAS